MISFKQFFLEGSLADAGMDSDLPGEAQLLEEHLLDQGYSKGLQGAKPRGDFTGVTSDQERTALEVEDIIDEDTAKQILQVALIWGRQRGYTGGETGRGQPIQGLMAAIWKDSAAAGKIEVGVRVPVAKYA